MDFLWIPALVGFIAQILCCVYGKNRLVRVLPMLAIGFAMGLTVLIGGLGFVSGMLLVIEAMLLAVTVAAYALCKLVLFAKK